MAEPGPVGRQTMSSAMPEAVNYHRWILSLLEPHVRSPLLEVGFGYGQYTTQLARRVERMVALDVAPHCLRQAPPLPGHVELLLADVTDAGLPAKLGGETFNTVVCLNVLEHIEDDVATLRLLRQALRPGGALLLLVPAHQALFGPMDALAGHFRRYRRGMLRERLAAAGLHTLRLRYCNPLGGLGWWVNARLARPRSLSDAMVNRQILLFDRYVQPVSRLLAPLTAAFFGQSLWAVALRPGEDH